MKVLGLDTSTSGCSAAVWDDGQLTVRRAAPMARGQAEALVPLAQGVLAEAGVTFAGLDRVAVTVGPGAFTGLRIALAAARGFALAADVPVVGVTSFAAIAHALDPIERLGRRLLVAVESRRTEPYLQRFGAGLDPVGEPLLLDPAAVPAWLDGLDDESWAGQGGPLLVAGDGMAALRPVLEGRGGVIFSTAPGIPDAASVAALGALGEAGLPPVPLYLRAPDVTLPKNVPSPTAPSTGAA